MSYIDLHVHSNVSDGTLSPAEVAEQAHRAGLSAIALTDHDTVAGVPAAVLRGRELGVRVIPGVELSCVYEGKEIHILGLFINCQDPSFANELKELLSVRLWRNKEMLRRFQADGFDITKEDLTAGNPDTVITRAHFARALAEKGYVSSMKDAFSSYLQYGSKYCLKKELITPEHAMKVLTDNHAFPALAHPVQYRLGWEETDKLICRLSQLGLMGLEVYHSSQTPEQSRILRGIARKYHLLPTGGSDFHGANKPDIAIGTGRGGLRLSHLLLEDIEKRLTHPPISSLSHSDAD